ncbi:MAG TPA: YfhO family protein [Anaerolineae bacterium]|nr:YfhO family protein [Anaerolineae bacterium]
MHRLPSPGRKLAPALALAALTALVVLFFSKMLFTNLIVARGDLYNYFYPYRDYAASAVREGRVPLWNPYLFMGAPFLANSQAGFFYPLNLAASWLETARAANLSIVAHVWIAAIGAYLFARRSFGASVPAALLGGLSFGLGGYLGAQVEHFNQLQALAWMPWLWLAYEFAVYRLLIGSLLVGSLVGVMLLAGHMQSVFIALVGLTAYALWPAVEHIRSPRAALQTAITRLVPILFGLGVAAALAAVQLLPTLELAGLSPRQGGLPLDEAVSFSLDPRLLGRALLPDYDGALPGGSEFTAFLGVSTLVVMIIGLLAAWSHGATAWQPIGALITDRLTYRSLSVLAFLGIFLALGGFNPLYYLLVKFVPGFDLFRAPARWLALFVFGGSMLAAVGLDRFGRGLTRITRIGIAGVMALLIGTTFISANVTPAGAAGPIGVPGIESLALWLGAALLTLLLATRLQPPTSNLQSLILLLCALELFIATRNLPYHTRLTAPDAWTSLRPPVAQLLVGASGAPAGRFLSISDIQFDPGDAAELESIYADQLPPDAYYDLLIATKQKEIVAPNQPLTYGLPAVDGYDGGLLPLRNYLTFQKLFLPGDAIQPDGRLREQLESIPDARWLDLMNVKYVITDKVRDRWFDGVFFDLQFETPLRPGDKVWTDQLPPLEANALGIVYSEPKGEVTLAEVEITFEDGSSATAPLADEPIERADDLSMTRLRWEEAQRVSRVEVVGRGGLTLHGVALIDERSDTFHSFALAKDGRFRLAHSGDVKVYEYVDALPRAFVVPNSVSAASDDEALALMQNPDFDPSKTVVIHEAMPPATRGELQITNYELRFTNYESRFTDYAPEHIEMEVKADGDGYLVLTDAWYPGWIATVDGEAVDILRADIAFRAVPIEAGEHRVEFRYEPQAFRVGALISGGALMLVVAALAAARING